MNLRRTSGLAIATLLLAGLPAWGQITMRIMPAGEGTLRCTVTNQNPRTVRFLRHETPFANEFESGVFAVTVNGREVPYIGKMVLRAGIGAEDWMELQPGETVSTLVHLPDSYDFKEAGNYTVTFKRTLGVRFPDGRLQERGEDSFAERAAVALEEERLARRPPEETEAVESNTTDVFVSEPVAPRRNIYAEAEQPATENRVGTNTYNGCTSSWISSLTTDMTQGSNFAYKGYSGLRARTTDAQRKAYTAYKTWYGAYSASNYTKVQNGFANIYNSFQRGWTVNCNKGCQPNWAAYVYPNQTYVVQICNGYFSYPASERGTILLHEASHWSAILGTQDYAYYSTNCQNLAKTSPAKAIMNADNYHFFSMYAN